MKWLRTVAKEMCSILNIEPTSDTLEAIVNILYQVHEVGLEDGYDKGYQDGFANGYREAQKETKSKQKE